ncbi:beta strand repeat-containing protein [Wenzhouxiangella marina]|nr:S-layer family protein [Wenzhouxiangella marina]MBB6086704.1 hypothetical protein [Wenzhouxiangella marina]
MNATARRAAAASTMPAWYAAAGGAATITVNTLAGDDDGVCGTNPVDPVQDCSVLEAVTLANSGAGADVIAFSVSGTIPLSAALVLLETVHLDGTTAPGGAGSVFLDGQDLVQNVVTVSGGVGSVIEGLTIGQSARSGILIASPAANVSVLGNFIGTNAAGDDLGNDTTTLGSAGVRIEGASGTVIGSMSANEANVIGFGRSGITNTADTSDTLIVGNFIGTNAAGADLGNTLSGLFMTGSTAIVGGSAPGAANVIGFNGSSGIAFSGPSATGNVVVGNFVGTNASGANLGNGTNGIALVDASNNTVGGTAPGEGNTVGFSFGDGIIIAQFGAAATGNLVQGNFVGTDATGTNLGNGASGVVIQDASGNTIGGSLPGAGNVIGANAGSGVFIGGFSQVTTGNVISGNYIGTNAAGAALGNGSDGIFIQNASDTIVGGSGSEAGNTIGFNASHGIRIGAFDGQTASGNLVQGNLVGTSEGAANLGNLAAGVFIQNASGNTVGGTAPGEGNTIGFNASHGIWIASQDGQATAGNLVQGNFVGTNETGADLGNGAIGILNRDASDNLIGGTMPGAGNVVGFNSSGIVVSGLAATGITVQGNFVGTDAAGADLGNDGSGISIENASSSLIGGTVASAGNVVGFNQDGIAFIGQTATGNTAQGNFVGTNATGGNLGNAASGIVIVNASTNTVGGTAPGAGNVVGFGSIGVAIARTASSTTNNTVQGNYIGTNSAGAELGNASYGILVQDASDNFVGGAAPGAGNILGFSAYGIVVVSFGPPATGNAIAGNFVGTNSSGANLGHMNDGIYLQDATDNLVGGTAPGAGNTIAFSGGNGVLAETAGTTGNALIGNFIGTNATGDDLGNAGDGIRLRGGSSGNIVGGAAAGEGNTIGFNVFGVTLEDAGTTGNILLGNFIGTNAANDQNLGNGFHGILVRGGASDNVIGAAGAGNTIAFSTADGVFIQGKGTTGNALLGNFIGTGTQGQNLGNGRFGVVVTTGAADNAIGAPGAGNTIGFSGVDGVLFQLPGTTGNVLEGNFIGTDAAGQNLGNTRHGVLATAGASGNTLGGVEAGTSNTIRFHTGVGVLVSDSTTQSNAILGNAIFDNDALGIDLSGVIDVGDGVTANDGCGDSDAGPNGVQNFPTLLSARAGGSVTSIDFDLDTSAGDYRVEFFSVLAGDPSGHGEGRSFLGAEQVTVSASCDEAFQVEVPLAVPDGALITATATRLDAVEASGFGGTSEFSAVLAVELVDGLFEDRFESNAVASMKE